MVLYQRIQTIVNLLLTGLYERDEALRCALLAALSGKSIFFLGPPGVAKSMIGRRVALAFDNAQFFEYLMGRFSTPDELFGPVSIARLKHADSYSRNVDGFLPAADIVFLDEIWKASVPIQNSLLAVLNERIFRNGNEVITIPMKCFIAASNEIRLDDESSAFWDRFLIRLNIGPIESESGFIDFLNSENRNPEIPNPITRKEWEDWLERSRYVRLSNELVLLMLDIRRALNSLAKEDTRYYMSDRRWKQTTELMKVAAFFHDRDETSLIDSFLLPHCLWNDLDHQPWDIFNQALKTWAFTDYLDGLEEKVIAFKEALTNAAYRNEEVTVLEPVKHEEEYLHFIPMGESGDTEYLLWSDDLENLDDRGELEFFIHRKGHFIESVLHPMKWLDHDKWELTGALGNGRIESVETRAIHPVAIPIPAKIFQGLQNSHQHLIVLLEKKIADLNEHLLQTKQDAKNHLFIPQTNITILTEAAEDRKKVMEEMLVDILLEGEKQGLSNAS